LEYYHHFDLEDVLCKEQSEEADASTTPEIHAIDGEVMYACYKKRLAEGSVSVASLAEMKEGRKDISSNIWQDRWSTRVLCLLLRNKRKFASSGRFIQLPIFIDPFIHYFGT
jgi:hypothetical protein